MKTVLIFKNKFVEGDSELLDYLNTLGKVKNLIYKIKNYNDIIIEIKHGKISVFNSNDNLPFKADFIYFKNWMPHNLGIAATLGQFCKSNGIPFMDEYLLDLRHGGKILQATIFTIKNIRTPHTLFIPTNLIQEQYDFIVQKVKLPFIIKLDKGREGLGNYLISDKAEFKRIIRNEINTKKQYIIQEYIANSFDYRYLIIGYKTKLVIKRVRQNMNDHRNNTSLGATRNYVPKTEWEFAKLAERTAKLFKRDICGIDIIVSEKTNLPYVLEINPSPGLKDKNLEDWKRPEVFSKYIKNNI